MSSRPALLLALAGILTACSDDSSSSTAAGGPSVDEVLEAYSTNLYAGYGDAVKDEQTFGTTVDAFLANPNATTLEAARTGWLASREHYLILEGARFVDGPIDVEPPNHEAALNSWPLDEAYVDYTTAAGGVVDETKGLINDPVAFPQITVEAIDGVNAQGGDENISNGYHAIEFLLWGQALTDVGPGNRPPTDYVVGGPRKNADRRASYLRTAIQGVTQHLTAVRDAWAPGAAYRTTFKQNGTASIALALTALGKMSKGELAGERMNAAYASKSRRDQHNCFSSTTLTDYERDARGLQQMYLGNYNGVHGASLSDLVKAKNADIDTRLQAQLQKSIDLMVAIPKPFEVSIVGDDSAPGRQAILATITSLRAQGDLFAEAATALGLTISVPEEN